MWSCCHRRQGHVHCRGDQSHRFVSACSSAQILSSVAMKLEHLTEHGVELCSFDAYSRQDRRFSERTMTSPAHSAACLFEAHGQSLLHVVAFNCDLSNQERSIAANLNTRGTPGHDIHVESRTRGLCPCPWVGYL